MQSDIKTFQQLSAQFSLIPLRGKVPLERKWTRFCIKKRSFAEKDFVGHNAGVACGPASGVIVLDIDNPEAFSRVCRKKGWELTKTYSVTTGSDKPHHYYLYPQDGRTYGCRTFKKLGFDIKGKGGQVVAAGSIHPDTNKPYYVSDDRPLVPAPAWLLQLSLSEETISEGLSRNRADQPMNPYIDNIDDLPITHDTKDLIRNGLPKGQRSEGIMSVMNALVWANLSDTQIFKIFDFYPIGEKYREKGSRKGRWLQEHLVKARAYVTDRAGGHARRQIEFRQVYANQASDQCIEDVLIDFNLTDYGNAERLVHSYGENLRYCHVWGKWLVWDGRRWIIDKTAEVERKAKDTVRKIYAEAARPTDKDRRKAIVRHAVRSESDSKIRAMISLAQSEPGIPVTPDHLDADPWLLNCLNGTIDLRTGKLRPHNKVNLITKLVPVEWDTGAKSELFQSFLKRIFAGNQRLISFVQRLIGYLLTGDNSEQCFFFWYGTGANGKTTLLELLRAFLNDYAQQTEFQTFLQKQNETVRNDLARLKGARLVSAIEVDAGKRLAEVLIKQVTGGDPICARFLYREYFEFYPTFKIILVANHRPQIWGTDHAIWRRIRVVPFLVTIPEEERDGKLKEKLLQELPGILTWAVEGCLEWQRNGLGAPDEVLEATEGYREEMDVLAGFIGSCCALSPAAKIAAKDLYDRYVEWCEKNSEQPFKPRTFGVKLAERGFTKGRGTGGIRLWVGLRLLNVGEEAQFVTETEDEIQCVTQKIVDNTHKEGGKGSPVTHSDTSFSDFDMKKPLAEESPETASPCVTCVTCDDCKAASEIEGREGLWCYGKSYFQGKSGTPTRITNELRAECPYKGDSD